MALGPAQKTCEGEWGCCQNKPLGSAHASCRDLLLWRLHQAKAFRQLWWVCCRLLPDASKPATAHHAMQTQYSQKCRPACPASSGWAHSAASGASLAREPCWAQRLLACLLHQESEAARLEFMAAASRSSLQSSDHAERLLDRTSPAPWLLHAPHLDRPVPTLPHWRDDSQRAGPSHTGCNLAAAVPLRFLARFDLARLSRLWETRSVRLWPLTLSHPGASRAVTHYPSHKIVSHPALRCHPLHPAHR